MSEKNCSDCVVSGGYCFKKEVEKIVSGIKDSDDEKKLLETALEAHKKITTERESARERFCHNINNVNPDYPGKELL